MTDRPWSNNQLKKLGKALRAGDAVPPGVPTYEEVIVWYNDLASRVQEDIQNLDWTPLLQNRVPEITSRAKTVDTLRDKLRRYPTMSLGVVQDLAGVRFEAQMTLDEQDGVANAIAGLFGYEPTPPCLHDLRDVPHSGYRAVHLWLELQGPVEVQIRTHLQGEWANAYEAAGDLFGREIRYDSLPASSMQRTVVEALRQLSTKEIVMMERQAQSIQNLEMQLESLELPSRFTVFPSELALRRELLDKASTLVKMKTEYDPLEDEFRRGLARIRSTLHNAKNRK